MFSFFLVGSKGSCILPQQHYRGILGILDLRQTGCRRILGMLDPAWDSCHRSMHNNATVYWKSFTSNGILFLFPTSRRCCNLAAFGNFNHIMIQPIFVGLKTSSPCWLLHMFCYMEMLIWCGSYDDNRGTFMRYDGFRPARPECVFHASRRVASRCVLI